MNPAEKAIAYLRELVEEPPQQRPVLAYAEGRVLAYADGQGRILRYGASYDRTMEASKPPPRLSRQQVLGRAVNEVLALQECAVSERDAEFVQDFVYSARERLDALREYVDEAEPADRAELGVIWRQVQSDREASAGAKFYIHTTHTGGGGEIVHFSNAYCCLEHALAHVPEDAADRNETIKIVEIPRDAGGPIKKYSPKGDEA